MSTAGAIVLAGGKSHRMRRNKALLPIGKMAMIERVIKQLRLISGEMIGEIIIATNSPAEYTQLGVTVLTDLIPEKGPLSGIHAGLKASRFDYNLVVACDMPFIDCHLAEYLIRKAKEVDAVVPCIKGLPQPLFAVYSRACYPVIEELLLCGIYKCTAFLPRVKVCYVEDEEMGNIVDLERVFFNVNTQKEWEQALEWLE